METRALIYCRVSSVSQVKEGSGLESQESRCLNYAAGRGYVVEKVFKDSFTGGGDFMRRPAMAEMIAYIDSKPHVNYTVIFDDLKRFARDVEFHLKLRGALQARNATPECLNFNFDDTPESRYVETILAAGAELERNQNKRQVIQKQKARLEAGYWAFNAKDVPGYRRQNHPLHRWILVKKEPEASLIKEAFEGYASGRFQEQNDVLSFLRNNDFRKGKPIYLSQVKRLLTRVLYAGYIEFSDWDVKRRKGHHEAIVSLETFEKVQEKLEGKAQIRTRKDTTADFPLRGFVKCEYCQELVTASWSTGRSGKHPYYRCKNKNCEAGNKSIRKKEMEDRFESLLEDIAPTEETLKLAKLLFQKRWDKKVSEVARGSEGDAKLLGKLGEEIESLSLRAAKATNDTLAQVYEKQIEKLAREELLLREKLESMTVTREDFGTALDEVFGVIKSPYTYWVSEDMESKRLALRLVFAEQIAYSSENGFGTPELSLPLRVFERIRSTNSQDVEMVEIESTSEKERI